MIEDNQPSNSLKMDDLMHEMLKEIEALKDKKDSLPGVPSGFIDLDRITFGWQKSELIVIAGRPGMGKTTFVLNCARNASVDFNKPVAIFSLEMSPANLCNRLISSETEIEHKKVRTGNMEDWEWQQIHYKIGKLEAAPLIIENTPTLDIIEFKQKCRQLKVEHDVQLIVVDYLQLMIGKGGDGKGIGSRYEEIGSVSRALKSIARELKVPVIALSQLSRAVENRPGSKRPLLSDLSESGSIEQDADMVLFLYRPEYYGLEVDEDNNPTAGIGEVIIAKHRNGETGRVRLRLVDKYVKFTDLEYDAASFPFSSQPQDFLKANDFIIRPTRMDQLDDEDGPVPF